MVANVLNGRLKEKRSERKGEGWYARRRDRGRAGSIVQRENTYSRDGRAVCALCALRRLFFAAYAALERLQSCRSAAVRRVNIV